MVCDTLSLTASRAVTASRSLCRTQPLSQPHSLTAAQPHSGTASLLCHLTAAQPHDPHSSVASGSGTAASQVRSATDHQSALLHRATGGNRPATGGLRLDCRVRQRHGCFRSKALFRITKVLLCTGQPPATGQQLGPCSSIIASGSGTAALEVRPRSGSPKCSYAPGNRWQPASNWAPAARLSRPAAARLLYK